MNSKDFLRYFELSIWRKKTEFPKEIDIYLQNKPKLLKNEPELR